MDLPPYDRILICDNPGCRAPHLLQSNTIVAVLERFADPPSLPPVKDCDAEVLGTMSSDCCLHGSSVRLRRCDYPGCEWFDITGRPPGCRESPYAVARDVQGVTVEHCNPHPDCPEHGIQNQPTQRKAEKVVPAA